MSTPAAEKEDHHTDVSEPKEKLCYDCSRLTKNLQYMRWGKEIEYDSLMWLGFRMEREGPRCPLCVIIKETVDKSQAAEPNPVNKAGLDIVARLNHPGSSQAETTHWRVELHLKLNPLHAMLSHEAAYYRKVPLGVIDSRYKAACSARLVDTESIDFGLVKDWLKRCQTDHQPDVKLCSPTLVSPAVRPAMYFIDIVEHCLVEAASLLGEVSSKKAPYVALSYVWGTVEVPKMTQNIFHDCSQAGGLLRMALPIPPTITDAMFVAQKLDFRYLWVDSLCIIQDDAKHLEASIAMMHAIYGEAELVIVAADSEHANSGIQGLRKRPDIGQKTVKALDHLTLTNLWNPWNTLAESRWSRRAWTLQERFLAQRCLIFNESKVFMTCKTRALCASEDQEGALPEVVATVATASPNILNFDMSAAKPESAVAAYTDLVKSYSKMELTNNCDIINAFRGIYTTFQHHNLTSQKDNESIDDQTWLIPSGWLDTLILWQPTKICSKRDKMGALYPPSWAWVAWESEVNWPHIRANEHKGKDKKRADQTNAKPLICACVDWQWTTEPPRINLWQRIASLSVDRKSSTPDVRARGGRYLVLNSSTAFLTVGNAGIPDEDEAKDPARPFDLIVAVDKAATKDRRCRIPIGCCPFDCEGTQDPELIAQGYYDGKCAECRFGYNHLPRHNHAGRHTHTAYRCCGFVTFNDSAFTNRNPGDECEFVILSESRDEALHGPKPFTRERALINTSKPEDESFQEYHLFNIMAIAPNKDAYGSHRRVGLGQIQKTAWTSSCSPKKKVVILA